MDDPNIGRILISMLGGLAIFILGMNLMTQALNNLAGSKLKTLLSVFTKNRFAAALTGATVTAAVQSSTVTTVLLVGFSSAGLISVAQSVGVIFGANVGSTVTAQIIAFKITEAGAPLLAIGLGIHLFKKQERLSQFGLFVLGLGAVFFGMGEMSDATSPLRTYEPFMEALNSIHSPIYGILIGLVFTAVVHSSAATIGLAIIFADQGLLDLESAIAISLGANIGTCVTAGLAAIGRPTAAWRIAFIHVIFNVAGVAIWYAFIPQLAFASEYMTGNLIGDVSIGREIAMAHTFFNVANFALFIGFTKPISKIASIVVPEKTKHEISAAEPIYLDHIFLNAPAMAIDRARLETGRLANFALLMSEDIPIAAIEGSSTTLNRLVKRDDELDDLQTAILNYLSKIEASKLSKAEQLGINEVIALVNTWENIGDTLDNHVIPLGRNRLNTGLEISEATRKSLDEIHQLLLKDMRVAMIVTTDRDLDQAQKLVDSKAYFNQVAEKAEQELAERLLGRDERHMDLFRLESDLMNNLKRIHYYVRRIAKITLQNVKANS